MQLGFKAWRSGFEFGVVQLLGFVVDAAIS